jgi:Flp pilus assembly protein TadG
MRRGRSSGQAMVEFALIVPLFFLLVFGVVEYSLINASVGAYNFAAKDAARLGAIIGKGAVQITTTTTMPVDQYMVTNIILPRVNGVVVAKMNEVDIFDAAQDGTCIPDGTGNCQEDVWTQVGGVWTSTSDNWPPSARNDALFNADYLGVRISYTYTYLTSFFIITSPVINLTAESIQRIEPQQYGDRYAPGAHAWANASPEWPSFTGIFASFTQALWVRRESNHLTGGRA